MLVCPSSHGWLASFPRHFELGQSVKTLSRRGSNFWKSATAVAEFVAEEPPKGAFVENKTSDK